MAYTTIDDPSAHFQAKVYTGNGNTGTAYTNDGNSDLQPDLLWFKRRDSNTSHSLSDTSRGLENVVWPDSAGAEYDYSSYDTVTAVGSDGFTVGTSTAHNGDGASLVCWQWKANGGSRTTNAEDGNNPAGGYQANTTAGFSIVDYTGTGAAGTMAHGLGAVPDLIIIKNRDEADDWAVYHSANTAAPETDYLVLNETDTTADDATYWNDTAPTSSVFTVTTAHNVNADAEKYMAYCFTEIQGYSKFGSYTGNGSADGPFVYLGFKPAFVIIKSSTKALQPWVMFTGKIATGTNSNPLIVASDADDSKAERGTFTSDLLSNGFKILQVSGSTTTSGETYTYMAFAEQPFVTSGGVPCTAR